MFFDREEIKANPKLADIKAVKVEQFDWGNIGEALTAHLKRLDRLDVNMVRAWYHGEREGMEAEHGSRADARRTSPAACSTARACARCSPAMGRSGGRDVAAAELPAVAGPDSDEARAAVRSDAAQAAEQQKQQEQQQAQQAAAAKAMNGNGKAHKALAKTAERVKQYLD
jgi:type IV secretory pathway VirB10-like protein